MVKPLSQRFVEYIENQGLLHFGSHVVAGVSGGADSVCLLVLLNDLRRQMNISLKAVHINHMIRGQAADEDEAFVSDLCGKLNLPLRVVRRDIAGESSKCGYSLEEYGRKIRYEILAKEAAESGALPSGIIAVAHHKNDNAETFILNLIRGSSTKGLSGMKSKSEINGVSVIRPLLFASRNEIEDYLSEIGQDFREDLSNSNPEYSRNRIRLKVIPELEKINPRAVDHIIKSTSEIKQAYEYVENAAKRASAEIISVGKDVRGEKLVALDIEKLLAKPYIIASKVVYEAIGFAAERLKDISDIHVANVMSLSSLQTGSRVMLPYGLAAVRRYESIIIRPAEADIPAFSRKGHIQDTIIDKNALESEPAEILINGTGMRARLELLDISSENLPELTEKNQYTKFFDYDKIKRNFVFGSRAEGDFIRFSGGKKSINRYFIDEKIPAEERDKIILLKDGNDVIWVVGRRISEEYKITADSKRAVKISVSGEKNGC